MINQTKLSVQQKSEENRVLITGCDGFVGSYLAELSIEMGFCVHGTVHNKIRNIQHLGDKIKVYNCNIENREEVRFILGDIKPNYIFHLAAQSLITESWHNAGKTFGINVLGTINLLECTRELGLDPLIEIICSSDEYGNSGTINSQLKESSALNPSNPYGVSKLAEDLISYCYWQAWGVKVIRIRPFSIIGPRKMFDACSDFARGIVEIERGKSEMLTVGNLDSVRDFVDIRDAVKAFWLLAKKGTAGQVYNLSSGTGYPLKDILGKIIALSPKHIEVQRDPKRLRPSDKQVLIGDNSKLSELSWKPSIPIDKTLSDILTYWRAHI